MCAVLTFHTPLGLRGIRGNQRDPQLRAHPPKLGHRLFPPQPLPRIRRALVQVLPIHVQGHRHPPALPTRYEFPGEPSRSGNPEKPCRKPHGGPARSECYWKREARRVCRRMSGARSAANVRRTPVNVTFPLKAHADEEIDLDGAVGCVLAPHC